MVDSHSSYCGGRRSGYAIAHGSMVRCSHVDGNRMLAQCAAIGTHPLQVYLAILHRDGHSSIRALDHRGSILRMAGFGNADSVGRQDHLVDDRAHLGTVLAVQFAQITGARNVLG